MSKIQPHNHLCYFAEIFQHNQEAFEDTLFLINVMSWDYYLDYHIAMLKEEWDSMLNDERPEIKEYKLEIEIDLEEALKQQGKNRNMFKYLLS